MVERELRGAMGQVDDQNSAAARPFDLPSIGKVQLVLDRHSRLAGKAARQPRGIIKLELQIGHPQ
jgi:hypothetical protein